MGIAMPKPIKNNKQKTPKTIWSSFSKPRRFKSLANQRELIKKKIIKQIKLKKLNFPPRADPPLAEKFKYQRTTDNKLTEVKI